MGVILDTCIWGEVERGGLTPADVEAVIKDEPVYLSPVTIAELEYGIQRAPDEHSRIKRHSALVRVRSKPCLTMDQATGELVGKVIAKLESAGKATRNRLHDIWMACQALQYNMGLLTLNTKDFKDIHGLRLIGIEKTKSKIARTVP